MIQYRHGFVVRADSGAGSGAGSEAGDAPLRIVAATEGRKADGLDLRMDRADLDRFKTNPVIGYGHDFFGRANLPIGRAARVEIDQSALMMDVQFDLADPFAAEVDRKYRAGFLHAFSIGFDAHGIDEAGVPESWELFEVSSVPLPMDPAALVQAGRTRALFGALTELRVGKVLSAKNKSLVEDAIAVLQALLEAAGDDNEGDGRSRAAIASHSTPTVDTPWDGPAAVAAAPNDAGVLRYMHAWRDPDGDPDAKATYRFPHHAPGTATAANLAAVRNGLSRLPQANIPDTDRAGVERHLRRHLDDADRAGQHGGERRPRLAAADRRLRLAQHL